MGKQTTYESAGVNIGLGEKVSKIFYEAAKQTWDNRKGDLGELRVSYDDFSGGRFVNVAGLPEGTVMNMGFDGAGTKIEAAERVNNHRTIAYDLFAMIFDDTVVRGGEPVLAGTILDVNSLGKDGKDHIKQVKQLAQGYTDAANAARVVIVNGEVAELGNRVNGFGDFNYNWGGTVVWFANEKRLFTGMEIKEGDSIVGLREEGFRSNGLSLVRKILQEERGDNWHDDIFIGRNLGDQVLTPSTIYSSAVCEMSGGWNLDKKPKAEVHGVAHITGGGLPSKLGRVLRPSGLGADINKPFPVSDLIHHIQDVGGVSDEEAYKTWNMGQGMVIITPEPSEVIEVARNYGIQAKEIGSVVKKREIRIKSKGNFSKGEVLSF